MEIRVHDRDKVATQSQLNPALFGDDGEDEKIRNVGYISGKTSSTLTYKLSLLVTL